MKKTKKKLLLDSILLCISYAILFVTWNQAIEAIVLPYNDTSVASRPENGFILTMNNFFEANTSYTLIPLILLIAANIYLLWHRIEKRKESVDHVVQHTYVTNFLYIIFKYIVLFLLTLLPYQLSAEVSPALHEIYLIIFLHSAFIALLFVVHHKNITFRKKKITF